MVEEILGHGASYLGGTPPVGPGATRRDASPADGERFEDLLRRIEELEHEGETATGAKVDGTKIEDALHQAEDGFLAAMDLRTRLEQAFRRIVREEP
jgi:hypothetical protein